MIYLRPHKGASRVIRLSATAIVAVLLLVGLIQWTAPHFFPGMFTSIAAPFWRARFSIESGSLRSPSQLLSENESLKRDLADLRAVFASSSVSAVLQENAELKAQAGRASTTPRLLAAVLARPPFVPYDELLIDVGTDDGVSTTSLVYAAGTLIGRVREALSGTAKVELFSSPGNSYQVLIGPSHVPATAIGMGGGQFRADVPHGSTVTAGDVVRDSAIGNGIFGMVVSVATDPANPFDRVLFAQPVNIYELRWVTLDKPVVKTENKRR